MSTAAAATAEETKEWGEDEEAILRTAFNLFDANKDGQVDFSELQLGLGKQNIRKSTVMRAIESADQNDDNMLNFEEFKELMTNNPELDGAFEEELNADNSAELNEARREQMLIERLGKSMISNDMRRSSVFGRLAAADESGTDLVAGLRNLDQELSKIPDKKKQQFLKAKEKCPLLMGDKFKIMFLRSDEYDPEKAAMRLVSYWEERVRVFGDKAFSPITQADALKDDMAALEKGMFMPVGKKDQHGQTLVLADFSEVTKGEFDSLSKARAFWYVMDKILQADQDSQLKGVVLLAKPFSKIGDFDTQMMKHVIQGCRMYIPVRMACVHVCYVPAFAKIMDRVVSVFAGEFKQRRRLHRGTTEQVLAALAEFEIPKDSVPTQLGGTSEFDLKAWLKECKEAEESS